MDGVVVEGTKETLVGFIRSSNEWRVGRSTLP